MMGGGCAECVDISPPVISEAEYPPSLPTFQLLDMKLDDVTAILYSSGTTGAFKGVQLPHRYFQYQLLNTR